MKFKEIASLWLADKKNYVKRSTLATYSFIINRHLLCEFGSMRRLVQEDIQSFVLRELESGLSHKSVKDILVVLKMIVRFGASRSLFPQCDWEVRYPARKEKPSVPVLSVADERKLIGHLMKDLCFRNLGILICLQTGMRIGEICGLRWDDIDLRGGIISVRRTVERICNPEERKSMIRRTEVIISTPKTLSSVREIPLSRSLLRLMKSMRPSDWNGVYLVSGCGKPVEPRNYRNHFRSLLDRLGIPRLKFHGLRHSFATRCIESRCDYKTVSTILGHSNIATTLDLYVHPDMNEKRRCVGKMLKSIGAL